ncbi:LysR family transcriptional regulator [Paracoccus benzoatiresistens]|uniref:LysR family transcriptional regulator n=1 Tax=Paracoccus benzoatiresistens TaxID=2997341 RepID=A0ABT4J633_9RHOB|nr:LysR family transcriptional regulator [Paracoccus sp. EF6]MCZ0962521.1 LysR family transcriptional regulator [Paracoccus sp. EF6]
MNFAHIRAFHSVPKEGDMARAAHVLGVSQSTLSQQIHALEARHALRLFEKRGRRLALTDTGRALLQVIERLMEVVDKVQLTLRGPGTLDEGHLSLMSDSTTLAIELMRRFGESYPSVSLSLAIASMDEIREAVRDGKADIGIAMNPPMGDLVTAEPLIPERFHLLLPCGHRLAAQDEVSVRDLSGETIIMHERGSRTHAFVQQILVSEDVRDTRTITVCERSAIREAVARRMGVAFFVLSEIPPDHRLACRPLVASGARLELDEYLLVRKDRHHKPVVAAFRSVVAGCTSEKLPADALIAV